MSPVHSVRAIGANRFPRVSGDEPEALIAVCRYYEFSPRERG